jgi:hypothetical protein
MLIVKGFDSGILCLGLLGFLNVSIISSLKQEYYISEMVFVSFPRRVGQEAPTQMSDRQNCFQSVRHEDCGVLNRDNMYMVISSITSIGRNLLPPSLGQKSGMQAAAKHCY